MVDREALFARDREILELHRSGLTHTAIGKRFGITRQRVYQVLRHYGEPLKIVRTATDKFGPERAQEIVRRHANGESINAIAKDLGVLKANVRAVLVEAGRPIESPLYYDDAMKAEAVVLYQAGHSMAQVGKRLGCSTRIVWHWLRDANVPSRDRLAAVRYPDEILEHARSMRERGATLTEIASALDVSIGSVRRWTTPRPTPVEPACSDPPPPACTLPRS